MLENVYRYLPYEHGIYILKQRKNGGRCMVTYFELVHSFHAVPELLNC